jgi:hypothetical protein
VQGVNRNIHGPEEGPDVLAFHIGYRVPLNQATSSTIQPFKRGVNLNNRDAGSINFPAPEINTRQIRTAIV